MIRREPTGPHREAPTHHGAALHLPPRIEASLLLIRHGRNALHVPLPTHFRLSSAPPPPPWRARGRCPLRHPHRRCLLRQTSLSMSIVYLVRRRRHQQKPPPQTDAQRHRRGLHSNQWSSPLPHRRQSCPSTTPSPQPPD